MNYFIKRLLYEIDFFKTPFFFSLQKSQNKISTKMGSLFSVAIFLILVLLFFRSNMFLKIDPSIISTIQPSTSRPRIDLPVSKFYLGFGIFDQYLNSYPIDPSIFNLSITQIDSVYDPLSNQTMYSNATITFYDCFDSYPKGYCVDEDLHVEGYVDEYITRMFYLEIAICNNITSNVICKSDQEIQNYFVGKIFGVSYQNHNFNYNDYLNPIQNSTYADYMWLDSLMYKTLNIFIQKAEFNDDDSFYFASPKYSETFLRDYVTTDFTFTQNTLESSLVPIATISFWSSNNIAKNSRTYEKIDQVLAALSGIANFLIFFSFILINLEQNLTTIKYLMTDLYDFDVAEDKNLNLEMVENHKETNFQETKPNIPNYIEQVKVNLTPEDQNTQKLVMVKMEQKQEKDSFVLERYSITDLPKNKKNKRNRSKSHPLNLTLLGYLKIKIKDFFKCSLNLMEQVVLKFEEEYYEITNLKFIFKLHQDLEKMKIVYFNSNQIQLFELLPNPLISNFNNGDKSEFQKLLLLSRSLKKGNSNKEKKAGSIQSINQNNKLSKIDIKFQKFL